MQARLPLVIAIGLTVANACAAADKLTFEGDIRPILRQHCFDCHAAAKELKGKLDLRLARFAIRGGETGSAIVPGKPDDSLLLERIRSGEMPPGEHQVPADQIAKFAAWIEQGAAPSLFARLRIGSLPSDEATRNQYHAPVHCSTSGLLQLFAVRRLGTKVCVATGTHLDECAA